jgi:hypothetical protein
MGAPGSMGDSDYKDHLLRSCSSSTRSDSDRFSGRCLSGQIQPLNFSLQIIFPSSNVCIGVLPRHFLPWWVRSLLWYVSQGVQIRLKTIQIIVNLAPQRGLIELLKDRLVEALADPIGLWVSRLGEGDAQMSAIRCILW